MCFVSNDTAPIYDGHTSAPYIAVFWSMRKPHNLLRNIRRTNRVDTLSINLRVRQSQCLSEPLLFPSTDTARVSRIIVNSSQYEATDELDDRLHFMALDIADILASGVPITLLWLILTASRLDLLSPATSQQSTCLLSEVCRSNSRP